MVVCVVKNIGLKFENIIMQEASEQLKILTRGSVDLIEEKELIKKLATNKPLTVKVGFDPTSPDLHLGHTVLFTKMRQFQNLGHNVVFLIGDFTALIGDPSGQNTTRPQVSAEIIQANAKTYTEQAFKILDKDKTQVRYNSEWMGKMNAADLIRLAQSYTVARMLERRDFNKRLSENQPIAIHEFLYPLVQAYDSVFLKCDVELGGTDQLFNLNVGRVLQERNNQAPQCLLTVPLLVGIRGELKMSKSANNHIGITEDANEIYAKIMSLSDERMWHYYELLSLINQADYEALKQDTQSGQAIMDAKKALAYELTARYHNEELAQKSADNFTQTFSKKELPDEIEEFEIPMTADTIPLSVVLKNINMVKSVSYCRRLYSQGGIKVDNTPIKEELVCKRGDNLLVQVGKRRFARLKL